MIAPVVAVDGPSGSGKGTVSQWLATTLGWHLLDSGALYRLVALAMQKQGIAIDDIDALAAAALNLDVAFDAHSGDGVQVVMDGHDVSRALRTEACARDASRVAALPAVREALLQRQQMFRQPPGLVADGRDMGTVVFPDAERKIFLTASAECRARRRHKQLNQKGISARLTDLLEEIRARDTRDQNRAVSPLKPAPDAFVLDTTEMNIGEVCEAVYAEVRACGLAAEEQ